MTVNKLVKVPDFIKFSPEEIRTLLTQQLQWGDLWRGKGEAEHRRRERIMKVVQNLNSNHYLLMQVWMTWELEPRHGMMWFWYCHLVSIFFNDCISEELEVLWSAWFWFAKMWMTIIYQLIALMWEYGRTMAEDLNMLFMHRMCYNQKPVHVPSIQLYDYCIS